MGLDHPFNRSIGRSHPAEIMIQQDEREIPDVNNPDNELIAISKQETRDKAEEFQEEWDELTESQKDIIASETALPKGEGGGFVGWVNAQLDAEASPDIDGIYDNLQQLKDTFDRMKAKLSTDEAADSDEAQKMALKAERDKEFAAFKQSYDRPTFGEVAWFSDEKQEKQNKQETSTKSNGKNTQNTQNNRQPTRDRPKYSDPFAERIKKAKERGDRDNLEKLLEKERQKRREFTETYSTGGGFISGDAETIHKDYHAQLDRFDRRIYDIQRALNSIAKDQTKAYEVSNPERKFIESIFEKQTKSLSDIVSSGDLVAVLKKDGEFDTTGWRFLDLDEEKRTARLYKMSDDSRGKDWIEVSADKVAPMQQMSVRQVVSCIEVLKEEIEKAKQVDDTDYKKQLQKRLNSYIEIGHEKQARKRIAEEKFQEWLTSSEIEKRHKLKDILETIYKSPKLKGKDRVHFLESPKAFIRDEDNRELINQVLQ